MLTIKQYKPTSASRRQMSGINYAKILTATKPHKALTSKVRSNSGRNNRGVITVRHQGSGNKKTYRMVDFIQNKINVPARVETIEYDPYRSAFISLVCYKDGERRYILTPKDMKVGDEIMTAERAPLKPGNRLKIKNIPIGSFIHNVELRSGGGGRLARSAGSYAEILAHEAGLTDLRMSSKEVRKVSSEAWASIGQVSNPDYNLVNIGKAGRSRWLGIRPTVRGSAMNPVDHPYGGGEGAQPRGTKRPKTMWGKVTGGHKTRHAKKWSSVFIIKRRPKVR
ncbi:MAG: 50S ribosomal protein L2 [Parcubacteria group bacterium GW2011_GWA2_47_8b]|uniref:Large ribosomal subunit protein uL2 n=2 Tax=Candidatus Harrisoniibacteriota TaxID=1817905 RepID=A0A1G1ZVH5_9BACT|nr:MAG: 50S ribosomal protein L2 [Parcubacteria group bacterium GW2011_GWA2_47_8b]KKU93266.1 MAG: 50S ribosomal protein L2 [Parcubacteria group bacterium GW2011_GWA1_48_11b]OGY65054.1 MAG: 50S ribosomal protein L2 [Candidatus Harrisonbacteria bacterium RIFCSPHIGHO2_12_FULL_48_16]OGY68582.1 MAG: 50S ribosomal protein L2 [Candidatus Harrisonbacteria bacterium RIFOXYA1_FULL_48_8]